MVILSLEPKISFKKKSSVWGTGSFAASLASLGSRLAPSALWLNDPSPVPHPHLLHERRIRLTGFKAQIEPWAHSRYSAGAVIVKVTNLTDRGRRLCSNPTDKEGGPEWCREGSTGRVWAGARECGSTSSAAPGLWGVRWTDGHLESALPWDKASRSAGPELSASSEDPWVVGLSFPLNLQGGSPALSLQPALTLLLAPLGPSFCQLQKQRILLSGYLNGTATAYLPQCQDSGDYVPVQCDLGREQCWCVDTEGMEVYGTRQRGRPTRCKSLEPRWPACPPVCAASHM